MQLMRAGVYCTKPLWIQDWIALQIIATSDQTRISYAGKRV